eukprot:UC1_evm3s1656
MSMAAPDTRYPARSGSDAVMGVELELDLPPLSSPASKTPSISPSPPSSPVASSENSGSNGNGNSSSSTLLGRLFSAAAVVRKQVGGAVASIQSEFSSEPPSASDWRWISVNSASDFGLPTLTSCGGVRRGSHTGALSLHDGCLRFEPDTAVSPPRPAFTAATMMSSSSSEVEEEDLVLEEKEEEEEEECLESIVPVSRTDAAPPMSPLSPTLRSSFLLSSSSSSSLLLSSSDCPELDIPLRLVQRVGHQIMSHYDDTQPVNGCPIRVDLHDFRSLSFAVASAELARLLVESIAASCRLAASAAAEREKKSQQQQQQLLHNEKDHDGGWDMVSYSDLLKTPPPPAAAWRCTDINASFHICPTYPPTLWVPSTIDDVTLTAAAEFRSKGRIPVLSYLHSPSGACISRCSQPQRGLGQRRSEADETLVRAIFATASGCGSGSGTGASNCDVSVPTTAATTVVVDKGDGSSANNTAGTGPEAAVPPIDTTRGHIIDCRPMVNAMFNFVGGKGVESAGDYQCNLSFLGIQNIHQIRAASHRMVAALRDPQNAILVARMSFSGGLLPAEATTFATVAATRSLDELGAGNSPNLANAEEIAAMTLNGQGDNVSSLSSVSVPSPDSSQATSTPTITPPPPPPSPHDAAEMIEACKAWLEHVNSILTGARSTADLVAGGASVLVHCSDGWDRTPQVCSLAQLMLDPRTRTRRGFCQLVAKDWLAFGHKFADRCGFTRPAKGSDREASPTFVQFLDCVWQLMRLYPQEFEFNEDFLLALHRALIAQKYGTFFGNSERERHEANVANSASSAWSSLLDPVLGLNKNFTPSESASGIAKMLQPEPEGCRFIWLRLYLPADTSGQASAR